MRELFSDLYTCAMAHACTRAHTHAQIHSKKEELPQRKYAQSSLHSTPLPPFFFNKHYFFLIIEPKVNSHLPTVPIIIWYQSICYKPCTYTATSPPCWGSLSVLCLMEFGHMRCCSVMGHCLILETSFVFYLFVPLPHCPWEMVILLLSPQFYLLQDVVVGKGAHMNCLLMWLCCLQSCWQWLKRVSAVPHPCQPLAVQQWCPLVSSVALWRQDVDLLSQAYFSMQFFFDEAVQISFSQF